MAAALRQGDQALMIDAVAVTASAAELNIMVGVTATAAELNTMTGILATRAELNRVADTSTRIVNATAATLTVTEALHDGKVITLNRAAGIAVTLPAAIGSGAKFQFITGTTVTSNTTTIKVVDATDIMTGVAVLAQDAGDTSVTFETAADTDTITLNGTTTGGTRGGSFEMIDIAADLWWVRLIGVGTGAEATPFSATVT